LVGFSVFVSLHLVLSMQTRIFDFFSFLWLHAPSLRLLGLICALCILVCPGFFF
jgi:hypothetical protein